MSLLLLFYALSTNDVPFKDKQTHTHNLLLFSVILVMLHNNTTPLTQLTGSFELL